MADRIAARRLARFRVASGLSQSEAAARWKISARTLQDWESRGVGDSYAGLIMALLDAAESR